MQTELLLRVIAQVASLDTSLDDLLGAVKDFLTTATAPGLVALLLEARDAALVAQWRAGDLLPPSCCAAPAYEIRDRQHRTLRTSLGPVPIRWRRLCCRHCRHSWVPLREALGLQPHQAASMEFVQQVVEQSSQQSYRQTEATFQTLGQPRVPKSTAHRWVRRQEEPTLTPEAGAWPVLLVDATNYQRRPVPGPGGSTRGDVRLVLGQDARGRVTALGDWSGASWREIGQALQARGVRACCLVSDGEAWLQEGLAPVVRDFQRCHWHLVHQLDTVLAQDGIALAPRRAWQQRLAALLAVELPPRSHGAGTAEERAALTQAYHRAVWQLDQVIEELDARGCAHGVRFLRNARPHAFTYLALWLRDGLHVPRTTSRIERVMERLAGRLKYLAKNWSEGGAAQMVGILLQRLLNTGQWLADWGRQLRLTGQTHLTGTIALVPANP